jgi:hypothetical protein
MASDRIERHDPDGDFLAAEVLGGLDPLEAIDQNKLGFRHGV